MTGVVHRTLGRFAKTCHRALVTWRSTRHVTGATGLVAQPIEEKLR